MIVGAGSAGCVLASRLSQDRDRSVLLIEAGGPDRSPKIKIPAAFAQQVKTKFDWHHETEPEPGCDERRWSRTGLTHRSNASRVTLTPR